MHGYSTDSGERRIVPLLLASVAITLAWLSSKILTVMHLTLPWWLDAPSTLGFYGYARTESSSERHRPGHRVSRTHSQSTPNDLRCGWYEATRARLGGSPHLMHTPIGTAPDAEQNLHFVPIVGICCTLPATHSIHSP
jgi:hypothetical protein